MAMDVDADAAFDGFLSSSSDVRRKAADSIQRWQRADPGGLVLALTARVASQALKPEARGLAAVLLRKALEREGERLGQGEGPGAVWCRPGLGDALLESLAAALPERALRRHAADAAAAAASLQFARGRAWPEFALLLARWCSGGRRERATVLQILEQLRDGADGDSEAAPEASSGACNWESKLSGRATSLYALLAFLEDHGSALHALLEATLRDASDSAARDAAARVYVLCVAGPEVPAPLAASVRDLAPAVAEAASVPAVSSGFEEDLEEEAEAEDAADEPAVQRSEACLQAVALAARADPEAWAALACGSGASRGLPLVLAEAASDASAGAAARGAALAALLELLDAAAASQEGCDFVDELAAHTTAAAAGVLAALPADESTDAWAEADDEEDPGAGASDDPEEALFDGALDAAGRLAMRGSTVAAGLRAAALDLLSREAWQARHAGLLILLRLACAAPEEAGPGSEAAKAALGHLGHVHPRVRWAALEVWARLLAAGLPAPLQLVGGALEALVALAGDDHYVRVRRRGLFVLLLVTSQHEVPFIPQAAELVFRRVLIPQASSPAPEVREACANIGQGLAASTGAPAAGDELAQEGSVPAALVGLWDELNQALEKGAAAAADMGGGGESVEIEWPADWR